LRVRLLFRRAGRAAAPHAGGGRLRPRHSGWPLQSGARQRRARAAV